MKSFYVQSGNVRVEEIGAQRTEFEAPKSPEETLMHRLEIARRRARSRAIREQNRNEQGKM
jgi:hypothetical protein